MTAKEPRQITLPEWIFDQVGQRFLVYITPDGVAGCDGGHDSPQSVAKAKHLIQSISCIAKPPETKWVMVKIEAVPEFKGKVNQSAINTLNEIAPIRADLRKKGKG